MAHYSIRRCSNCNYKTHRRYWKNQICPVCESGTGYMESLHGGLTEAQMSEARQLLISNVRKIEGSQNLTNRGQERHY